MSDENDNQDKLPRHGQIARLLSADGHTMILHAKNGTVGSSLFERRFYRGAAFVVEHVEDERATVRFRLANRYVFETPKYLTVPFYGEPARREYTNALRELNPPFALPDIAIEKIVEFATIPGSGGFCYEPVTVKEGTAPSIFNTFVLEPLANNGFGIRTKFGSYLQAGAWQAPTRPAIFGNWSFKPVMDPSEHYSMARRRQKPLEP